MQLFVIRKEICTSLFVVLGITLSFNSGRVLVYKCNFSITNRKKCTTCFNVILLTIETGYVTFWIISNEWVILYNTSLIIIILSVSIQIDMISFEHAFSVRTLSSKY